MKDFVEFYTNYDEDGRLQRHRTEFVTTTYILDKFIHNDFRILDVGAGTGAYSLYYAAKGCSVVAIDAVPKYIEIIRSKLQSQPNLDVQTYLADVRNLSLPLTTDFDVVLFMGPIYHLPQQELRQCLDTCLRMLKKDGILAASYVNTYERYEDEKYPGVFVSYSHSDIERLLVELNLSRICHVPTDGEVFGELNELVKDQSEPIDKLHAWLDKHQSALSDSQWISKSVHGLYVGRKK